MIPRTYVMVVKVCFVGKTPTSYARIVVNTYTSWLPDAGKACADMLATINDDLMKEYEGKKGSKHDLGEAYGGTVDTISFARI